MSGFHESLDAALGRAGEGDVEALRQKILALPPTDSCGHLSFNFNGNCMTCQREADIAQRIEQAKAKERERIASAIEAYRDGYCKPKGLLTMLRNRANIPAAWAFLSNAARIAREVPNA